MFNTLQVNIPIAENEEREIIIALLAEEGYHGFEETETLLSAFITENLYKKRILEELLTSFQLSFNLVRLEERNWNSIWENEYEPIVVDDYVAIRAIFHPPILCVANDIIITPKMSFGTGHHATTFLMIDQMRNIDFSNKRVLDFGTGTGILSILSSRLGAKEVIAIDNDELSIENAIENIWVNSWKNISVLKMDNPSYLGKFDIILSNINLNTILKNLSILKKDSPSAILLLSGFLVSDSEFMIEKCKAHGYLCEKKIEKEGWLCLRFVLPKNK